jgi:hypothetical protein
MYVCVVVTFHSRISLSSDVGLTFINGTSDESLSLAFTATLFDANVAFRRVMYSPLPLQNGEDSIVISVTDVPPPGSPGYSLSCTNDISIWIQAVNTAPTLTTPVNFTAAVNVLTTLVGVSFDDPDITNPRLQTPLGVADSRVRVSVEVIGGGRLTLNSLAGLRFVSGTGWQLARAVVEGALVDINLAFSSLQYFCTGSYGCVAGDASMHQLVFVVNDLGNIGPPGAMSATANVPVSVLEDPYP